MLDSILIVGQIPQRCVFLYKKPCFRTIVYLESQTKYVKQHQLMLAQEITTKQKLRPSWKYNKKLGLQQKIKFLTLCSGFKFKQIITFNINKCLHSIHGQLVYNNASPVAISITYQNLFESTLNKNIQQDKSALVFSIETQQILAYSGKFIGLSNQKCEFWIQECDKEVLAKKRRIMNLLAVAGFKIDSQTELIKRIIQQKRLMKQKLQQVFAKASKQPINFIQNTMINENDESNVIFFGRDEDIIICPKESQHTAEDKQGRTIEGGYFTIKKSQYIISNRNSSNSQEIVLCRKTLRQKKKVEQNIRQMNQRKMKKEIQIVQSVKNKKYLIKYYCGRDLDNLEEILMENYDYSLQQYINYFADSLEIQHKILIAKQIVEAVAILHQSGVVHRDIKPSNFLVSDHAKNSDYYQLKIIDFAQSYSQNISYYKGDYACSHPYSPLQCSELKQNSSQRIKQGIQNKQIDYWSVGMLIYQVFFRKLPLSFSRVFHSDIAACWKSELLLTVNQRQKYGLAVVQDMITILCIKMLKIEQQKRMRLDIAMNILDLAEEYVKNVLKIVEEAQ